MKTSTNQDQAGLCSFNGLAAALDQETYFQKSDVFQWFCKMAFWYFFTFFMTASKPIELQKPDWTTFEAFRSVHGF